MRSFSKTRTIVGSVAWLLGEEVSKFQSVAAVVLRFSGGAFQFFQGAFVLLQLLSGLGEFPLGG